MNKIFVVFITLLFESSCYYHNTDPKSVLDITLYDKPVPIIKLYLAGKWKLIYSVGGFSGGDRINYDNTYFEFDFQADDTFKRTDNGKVTVNSVITWKKYPSANASSYFIDYTLPNGVPLDFYPKGIQNGGLILVDPCCDGY